jgi:hypothetical protein
MYLFYFQNNNQTRANELFGDDPTSKHLKEVSVRKFKAQHHGKVDHNDV